ncbi:MAG: alpha/beta fold hydrolase [Polyangiales bacterium]
MGEVYVEDSAEHASEPASPPAVVLWHSFLHHGGMWNAQVKALLPTFRVINVDAPGHGRSARLEKIPTMRECADVVATVLDVLRVSRAAICGISWGGMVAMSLALGRPDRVGALVLIDSSCRREPLVNKLKYNALGRVFRALGGVPMLLDRVEPLFFSESSRAERPPFVEEWRAYVSRMDRASVWNALQCIAERPSLTSKLSSIHVPTLVMVGRQDRAQPVAQSRAIAQAIPSAKLLVIEGAAHLSILERPRETSVAMVEFLTDHAAQL